MPILIGVGFNLPADEYKEYRAARVCFWAAAVWAWGKALMWSVFSSEGFGIRAVTVFIICGIVGIGLMELLRLTARREQLLSQVAEVSKPNPAATNQSPISPAPIAPQPAETPKQLATTERVPDQQFHLDQRAWIGIEDIRSNPSFPTVGDPLEAVVVFHNSGKTAAERLEGCTVGDPVKRGESPNFSYARDSHFAAGLVSPGTDHHVRLGLTRSISKGTPAPLTQELLDAINAGDLKIYIHGRISYNDIFGAHHWMTFCYFWDPETRAYAVCAQHNEMDSALPPN